MTETTYHDYSLGDEGPARTGNWIKDHWRGALGLAPSFWINLVALGVLFNFLATIFAESDVETIEGTAYIGLSIFAFGLAWGVWAIVGTWRSAGFHKARGGSEVAAGFTRFLCFMNGLSLVVTVAQYAPVIVQAGNFVVGEDIGEPASIYADGSSLYFDGMIRVGDTGRFQEALNAAGSSLKEVRLTSSGGRIYEATQMADLISARGLDTYVDDHCESACTFMFLAGQKRHVSPNAGLGFHSPSNDVMPEQDLDDDFGRERALMREAGLSRAFVDRAMATPSEDMWYPTYQQLREENIVTGTKREDMAELQRISAEAVNKNTPQTVDDITRLVSVTTRDVTVIYHMEITEPIGYLDMGIMNSSLLKSVCGNKDMRLIVDEGGAYEYHYSGYGVPSNAKVVINDCSRA